MHLIHCQLDLADLSSVCIPVNLFLNGGHLYYYTYSYKKILMPLKYHDGSLLFVRRLFLTLV